MYKGMHKKISLILILILIPFLVSCFPTSQSSLILNANFKEEKISNINPILYAGNIQYFNVTTSLDAQKIIIIAYQGNNIPEPHDRSIKNYYRWEYDCDLWKDVSGHDTLYIRSSDCLKENHTYSFYIGIDNKAKPGHWTIKVIVDDTEISSISSLVIVTSFNFFLSSIIGLFEPNITNKRFSINSDLILSDRKRITVESEKNIEEKIDRVIKERNFRESQEKENDETSDLIVLNEIPSPKNELIKSIVTTYSRSRLKKEPSNTSNSLFFNKRWGGKNNFNRIKIGGYKKLITIILSIVLLLGTFLPIIISTQGSNPPDITIINVQSYPVVGGEWVVMFTTVGRANLTITAVNGTTWSNSDENHDLKFLEVTRGNETLEYEWVNNSVFIGNYSSNKTGYKTSKVLTSGSHSLMFEFGNDIAYAYNDASNWWNASWNYRKLITLNSSQVASNLNNFPVLVYRSSDTDLANDSKCQNDGDDITFIAYTDNSTKLNHEIEKFDGSTGEIVSWVNITSLSSSIDTKIWMYYGNSSCSSQENVVGTWDSNYVAVWHFHNNSLNDSTSNGYDGINNGTLYNASCRIAGGREYKGENRTDINNFATISTELTAETWVYRDPLDSQSFLRLFVEGTDWNANDWCLYWRTSSDNMRFVINNNDYSTGGIFTYLGTWFHTALTYETGDAFLYKNGALEVNWSGQYGSSINNVYDTLTIGNQNGGGRDWIGKLDEVRISKIRRSADWLNTSYNTMNSPETFLNFGNEHNVTDTSVNKIIPYTVTYSPLSITATAASGLNNVTLWYRYSTDNSSWDPWIKNITDILTPWEWSFKFPNGTGYYEFYSIGKRSGLKYEPAPTSADTICYFNKSLNTAPVINLINPAPNGTTGLILQPNCKIWANDSEGDSLDIYWYENSTGPWLLQQKNGSVSPNSTFSWTYTQANTYGTKYWWKVAVNDSIDNTSVIYYFTTQLIETSVNQISPYILYKTPETITASDNSDLDNVTLYYRWSNNNFSWVTLTYDDFEAGWGNYTDGGADCYLYTGEYAHQGSNASGIQDNSGVISSFYHTSGIDVHTPGFKYIKVEFWFQAVSMEYGEDFWVRYYNGTAWSTISTYVAGTDFVNDQFYHETIWINESDYLFPNNMQIRFQCDASSNFDDVYIDQVWVNATGTNWIVWSNTSNPDLSYPWSWDFNFPNGTGYYEFYSIGKKTSVSDEIPPSSADTICYYNPNPSPTIQLISPENSSIGVNLQPTCQIQANDGNGDNLNIYWYENTTGPWILRQTNNSVVANSTVNWVYTQANANGITYWWKVAVNDSESNTSAWFYFTTQSLETSVDLISPYVVTSFSPPDITATGSSDLDNVTLYYRWSDNNFSWVTLTYDNFEDANGDPWIGTNYTDGGADCLLYTDGPYAHQGSNAANIQENSGIASSFYHTNGIDVHTPGFEYIKVEFWFQSVSMENGEDFWVRYFDGSSWTTVATYVAGTDFVNDQFYHETVWINESVYTFPSDMQIRFQCDASSGADDVYIDQIYINATTTLGNYTIWAVWNNPVNPDITYPWNWSFDYPDGKGYYEFYSIGKKSGSTNETPPASADAKCYYYLAINPIINIYNLMNGTGSKLNNVAGLLDVNNEYYFIINITEPNGWDELEYINITAWYDNGSDSSTYNQTNGGNLNMFLQYDNTTGTANFNMLWPDNEAQLVLTNCSETVINSTTRIVNISFKPGSQVRWASSNDTWDATQNTTNDPYSWNFNITVRDAAGIKAWKVDEYGVYRFTSILPNSDWVDVVASPGFSDTSNIVTITYSSNYNFNMSIYFEENLTNITWMDSIPIANNVWILGVTDPNDDITSDKMFNGIGEINTIDIFNTSGIFSNDNVSQTVNVQFSVDIPFGTHSGEYTARVATKIAHD